MAMENTFDSTAIETIELLEARLRRIEYAICGQVGPATTQDSNASAAKRLTDLEQSLHQLASKSRVVQDLLTLHARYPDLFQSINADDTPTTLDTSSILSIILASSSSYSSTASRLTSILDVPVPAAELSAQLVELVPRIAQIEAVQATQNADIADLRARSAAVIQQWYTNDILHAGDSWAGLEGRVEQAEQKVRRATLAKKEEENMV